MPVLKLAKLPNRASVKHTIVVIPELAQKLRDYADVYRQFYGEAESIEILIPYILKAFLDSDREFAKIRKEKASPNGTADRKRKVNP